MLSSSPTPTLKLSIMHQISAGERIEISEIPAFAPLCSLVYRVLDHFVRSETAQRSVVNILEIIQHELVESEDPRRPSHAPKCEDIRQLLLTDPPRIVLADLESKDDALVWGRVESSRPTDVYIQRDLCLNLSSAAIPPPDLTGDDIKTLRLKQSHLIASTLVRELMHFFTKHFHYATFTTPRSLGLFTDKKGNGESGLTLENNYLGYLLGAVWNTSHFASDDHDPVSIFCFDDDVNATISKILNSFDGDRVYRPSIRRLQTYEPKESDVVDCVMGDAGSRQSFNVDGLVILDGHDKCDRGDDEEEASD
ncbi:hypothetical protein GGX14DRAFT_664935 [Mycena pura]|uniref:Uncharacterized protein n=1 Tax=Mycena pura TaxID=153505 RepID=A0AAD6Y658_9AGAR|nr:hypothetical protein GGX14DRAFT_664935 [Mycena pura]